MSSNAARYANKVRVKVGATMVFKENIPIDAPPYKIGEFDPNSSRKQSLLFGLFHYNSIGNQFLRSVKKSRMLVFHNMEMSSLNSNIISFPTVADKMEVWITPSSYYVFEFFSLTRPLHGGVSAFAS